MWFWLLRLWFESWPFKQKVFEKQFFPMDSMAPSILHYYTNKILDYFGFM